MRTEPRIPLSSWTSPKTNRQYCQQRREFRKRQEIERRMRQEVMFVGYAYGPEPIPGEEEPEKVVIQ